MMYTEFISSDGLVRDTRKSLEKLKTYDFEAPIGIQIYGSIPEAMVDAAVMADRATELVETHGADVIDINFGCPVNKIARRGAGSGMTEEDTEDAPVFPYIWEKIAPKIEGLPLVAHNSRFDEGCLKAAFMVYRMDYPEYEFHDTLSASRKHFGCRLPDHQLQTVAAACGYDLTNHHHALADAEACAHIAIKIL